MGWEGEGAGDDGWIDIDETYVTKRGYADAGSK